MLSAAPKKDKKTDKEINVPPKTLSEISQNLIKIINLVSIKYLPLKELLDYAKDGAVQTNQIIKLAAIELLKTLYKHVG